MPMIIFPSIKLVVIVNKAKMKKNYLASVRNVAILLSKNEHHWTVEEPVKQGRTRKEHIVLHLPGPKEKARTVQTAEQF